MINVVSRFVNDVREQSRRTDGFDTFMMSFFGSLLVILGIGLTYLAILPTVYLGLVGVPFTIAIVAVPVAGFYVGRFLDRY